MNLLRRDPDRAYFDNWLWLPKKYVSVDQIRATLTYVKGRDLFEVWGQEQHHYRVPRNYFETGAFTQLPYPVVDARIKNFPRVDFNSRVVLDAKEPSKTYQREGSQALLNTYDGILCLRCGAGKTVVSLHTAAQLKQPVLIIVQDKGLARQWIEEIEEWLGIPERDIGRIGGDQKNKFDWEHKITIAIVNTLAMRAESNEIPMEMIRHFGIIIGDEAHTLGAPFFNRAIPPFHGRRWGLSATPTREDDLDSLLRFTMGNVVYTYLIPDLKPTFVFKMLPTQVNRSLPSVKLAINTIDNELHLFKLYNHIATYPDRTARMATEIQKAISTGRQVLVLTHSREMIESLTHYFPDAGVCHGGVGESDRLHRIRTMNPVIAIMRLGKQALNKPKLDTLFICDPFTKAGVLQQTMGRILRSLRGKKQPLVVIFEDKRIPELRQMCKKIRRALFKWPPEKGGKIPFIVRD